MSRVGGAPVKLSGAKVKLENNTLYVEGAKGKLFLNIPKEVKLEITDEEVKVIKVARTIFAKKIWGTIRSLINNMVIGVTEGIKVTLLISGVGYRALMKGKDLSLQLGYSYDITFPIPEGIKITCPNATTIEVEGADKQLVGQVAANIRSLRKPEPYKGKGIKYSDEIIVRKEGKKK